MQNSEFALNPLFIDQVYERLLESISFGEMKPGERVRQSALAERLGVSRQPISHALQLLKHQGLVRDAGKQGVEVTPLDGAHVLQLYSVRAVLEEKAGYLAAERVRTKAGQAEANELSEALMHGTRALHAKAPRVELVRADYQFHMTLYKVSGNVVIQQMMTGQWPHILRSMMAVLEYGYGDAAGTAWEEHARITAHVLAGDSAAAAQACAAHMRRAEQELRSRFEALELLTRE